MLATAVGGVSRLGDGAAPPLHELLGPEQRDLPSGLSLHTNWMESSDEEKETVDWFLHQPMKSRAAKADAGCSGSIAAVSPDCCPRVSPAHLIAPSRTASQSLEIRTNWPVADKACGA